jgi:hypothetical protein
MIGAIAVHFLAYRFRHGMKHPFFSREWFLPTGKDLPPSLFLGAGIFGLGWGFAGYCPGPALVSLASLQGQVFVFVAAMIAGMLAARRLMS